MANQFVAYQDERHGLGAWVAEQIAADLFRYGHVVDDNGHPQADTDGKLRNNIPGRQDLSQRPIASAYGMSLSTASYGGPAKVQHDKGDQDGNLNFAYRTWTSPRTTAESTVSAVISSKAQVGVVPLYDADMSLNRDTLAALIDFPQQNAIREYVAESNYVLAAPTNLVHEIEQAGYTNSFSPSGSTKSFEWNAEKQQRYLRKVTTIYATADAMKNCEAALEGFRAQGIDVQMIPEGVDAYRQGLEISSQMLDPNRRIETHFSGSEHTRISRTRGVNHTKPVIGVLLSADKAMKANEFNHDSDYVILQSEMAGADRIRSSFLAIKKGIPPFAPPTIHPVDFEMKMFSDHFHPKAGRGGSGRKDHRSLNPMPQDEDWPSLAPIEVPNMVRVLYKFNTVGGKVPDYSGVLKSLTEQGLSFQTTTLDNKPGHPMIVAIDVPSSKYKAMRPVLRNLMRLPAARRIVDFPAVQAMVKEEIRPIVNTDSRTRKAFALIGVVIAALTGYAIAKM